MHPCIHVLQGEWATPKCEDWVATLEAAIAQAGVSVVLVP